MAAMSGGVDSAAAAALLLDAGFETAGGTLRLFDGPGADAAVRDAAAVAGELGIRHFVYGVQREFSRQVVDYLAETYLAGETPNPCVRCNSRVKFPAFLRCARADGYGKMATGHYARGEYDAGSGRWLLKRGLDRSKDQSYFLYALSQDVLSRVLFPLGALTKAQAREIAGERKLSVASRPESQDVCFLPDGDYVSFIGREYGYQPSPGDFLDVSGRTIGRHGGALGYTPGQRRGTGVSSDGRLYVVSKDVRRNTVTLGGAGALLARRVFVRGVNLIAAERLDDPVRVEARLRYSRGGGAALLTMTGPDSALLEFQVPQRAPAPGQSAVFYDGDTVVGGGIISCADGTEAGV